ncbi:hypothetical protein INS49_005509 [Diaporthe citri]|uniref:uncharacterized protein n=1 Tax=Diaporthe citri TaxID=83186 RepID=UPI001C7F1CCF|nr:uncharacterized protein INS49_005509 [Diaporthe citri]KAG6353547.1 hypothetical protein INS49_005509 [Diaporthe citri]
MYRYQALPSREDYIRRLVLEPGEDDAPLVGRLETIQLRSAAELNPFRAISYAWGSGNKDQIITVNGNRLEITTSLRDSLLQARDAHSTVALWADGICINQDNDEEKNGQVALMGRIYETSRCTLICLGPGLGTEDRQHASDVGLIAEVETLIREVFEDPKFSWDWNSFPYPPADHALVSDYRWDSWERLVRQPWFHRGWVVQEAALGPDALTLWAGEEIRLVSVLRVAYWITWRAKTLMATLNILTISAIHLDKYQIQHPEEARTFRPSSQQHRIEGETRSRDLTLRSRNVLERPERPDLRVYGFEDFDKAMPAVRPNYGKDVSHLDVYRDFAIKYLEQTSDLDILCFLDHEEKDNSPSFVAVADARVPSFPSWVPRWDSGPLISEIIDRAARKITCIEGEPNNSRGSPISIIEGLPVLRVRAIAFGSVIYVSEPIEEHDDAPEKAVAQVFSLWRNLVRQPKKHPGPNCGISGLAFLTVLLFGRFVGDWQDFQSLLDLARRLQSDQPSHTADAYSQDLAAQRISLLVAEQSRNRRVVLIDRGYYATASNITREGDLCTIIHGTRTPFILRRVPGKQDQYNVVGPAFVLSKEIDDNGIPYRLAEEDFCDDWKDWDLQSEEIILV